MPRKMTSREQRLYEMLRRVTHYAGCLEKECERLGNSALADPRNTTLSEAQKLIYATRGEQPPAQS